MKIRIIPILALMLIGASSMAQEEWKLSKSGHGVEVYTRKTPASPIKEYKAEVVVPAPINEVVEFFNKIELHPEWMAGISSATPIGDDANTLHYILDAPFPMTDRYVLLQPQADDSNMPGRYWIAMENVDVPMESKLVRIARLKGGWTFEKVSESETLVRQQFVSDPGGSMPDWIVNIFIVKNPYHSLKALKELYE